MLKKYLAFIALLLSLTSFSQDSSWVNVQLLPDQYADETTWEIYNSDNELVATSPEYIASTYQEIIVPLDAGNYNFVINDAFGDGICCGFGEGWFGLTNTCGLDLYVYDFAGLTATIFFTLEQCAQPPPLAEGCTDTIAENYDPEAVIDNGTCTFPPCDGLDEFSVETYCNLSNVVVLYEWADMPNPNCKLVAYHRTTNLYNLGNNWNPYTWDNTGIMFPTSDPNTTYYFLGQLADGSYTDTLTITTGECIAGCLDETASNYNPWANVDDGSCLVPPANCVDGESNILVIVVPDTYVGETSWDITDSYGTTIAASPLYNQTGIPIVSEVCILDGTVINFNLYDSFGDGLCGSCYGGVDGMVSVQTLCGDNIYLLEPGNANFGFDTTTTYTVVPCTPLVILGCTDQGFTEYNPQATEDDGSCITSIVLGCTDITSPDYEEASNTMLTIPMCDYTLTITDGAQDGWFGSWIGLLQDGITYGPYQMGPDDGASESFIINLNSTSPVEAMFFAPGNSSTTANQCGFYLLGPEGDTTLAGGTNAWTDPILKFPYKYSAIPSCGNYCTPGVVGCMDTAALNYNPLANMPDTCIPIVLGCTNDLAFNYDPAANVDDTSCTSIIIGCMDSLAFNYNSTANTNDPTSCIPVILGCMDDTAFNYNAAANTSDDDCLPIVFGCTDLIAFNYDPVANTNNGSCIQFIYGCIDVSAFNYDPEANTNDDSCIPIIYGCTDNTMFNYMPSVNVDNGSCIEYIYGCTDSNAFNYDQEANTDNDSCIDTIIGCTDVGAYNYDLTANISDEISCLYDAGCYAGPGIPYWLNDGCYAWVIDVDDYCCTNDWDASCQSMYNYCQEGWPTGIDDLVGNGIMIYPNPTTGNVNIETHLDIEYELRDVSGKLILTGIDNRIDLSRYESGIYFLTIIHKNKRFNKRLIKQ